MKFNVVLAAFATSNLVAATPVVPPNDSELAEFAKDSCRDRINDPNHDKCLAAAKKCGPSAIQAGVAGSPDKPEVNPECLELEILRLSNKPVTAAIRLCLRTYGEMDKCVGIMDEALSEAANKDQTFLQCINGTGPKKAKGPTKAHLTKSICDNPKVRQLLRYDSSSESMSNCSRQIDWELRVIEDECYGN